MRMIEQGPAFLPSTPSQTSLPLDAPPLPPGAPLLPARMVNEYVYCPRLAYLEWVPNSGPSTGLPISGRPM